MDYRLLKDLPGCDAGTIFMASQRNLCVFTMYVPENRTAASTPDHLKFTGGYCENMTDWFEPIYRRWVPKDRERYWFVTSDMEIFTAINTGDSIKDGNCFRAREHAEEAKEAIGKLLDELHKKWQE